MIGTDFGPKPPVEKTPAPMDGVFGPQKPKSNTKPAQPNNSTDELGKNLDEGTWFDKLKKWFYDNF